MKTRHIVALLFVIAVVIAELLLAYFLLTKPSANEPVAVYDEPPPMNVPDVDEQLLAILPRPDEEPVILNRKKKPERPPPKKTKRMKARLPLAIYADVPDPTDLIYQPAGWMGDVEAIQLESDWDGDAKRGDTCMRAVYSIGEEADQGWAGVYWQFPAENWGDQDGGLDLTGAKKISFWARGEKGNEIVSFKVGGIGGEFRDSVSLPARTLQLDDQWKYYSFDLAEQNLERVNGVFSWTVVASRHKSKHVVFYLDDVWVR